MIPQHSKPHHFLSHFQWGFEDEENRAKALILLNILAVGCLFVGLLGVWQQWYFYKSHFFPGVTVDATSVGNLTLDEAISRAGSAEPSQLQTVTVTLASASASSRSAELGIVFDREQGVARAQQAQSALPYPTRLLAVLQLTNTPIAARSPLVVNDDQLSQFVTTVSNQFDEPGTPASLSLNQSGSPATIKLSSASASRRIDQTQLKTTIETALANLDPSSPTLSIEAPLAAQDPTLTTEQQAQLLERAKNLVGKQLNLTSSDFSLKVSDQDLVTLLGFQAGINQARTAELFASWTQRINRNSQDATFEYDKNSLKVSAFTPPRLGLRFNQEAFLTELPALLTSVETSPTKAIVDRTLPVSTTNPTITLESTNDLGIKELIGFGDSEFFHSIPSRIHNVELTANRINNTIVKPGEEFSFNKGLGDVSAATGYQPAYVIKGGQTVLGDGGGVCQVSTTLFRALLDSGVKITKRKPHSYRVSYYELNHQPGFDATVYSGGVDLRFINDTNHAILIHTETDIKNLYMKVELYGTSDGRTTEIKDYKSWDFRGPPAAQYIPDPTLPPGKLVQIDWSASGIKTSFTNVIKDKNGNILREDTFSSNYIPWSAKYRQGV